MFHDAQDKFTKEAVHLQGLSLVLFILAEQLCLSLDQVLSLQTMILIGRMLLLIILLTLLQQIGLHLLLTHDPNPVRMRMSQTWFSLYLHNQWTNFHKLSYTRKPKMRAIHTYMGCTKAATNDWDIRPSVAVKALSANISWTAEQIRTIKLVLESAHQSIYCYKLKTLEFVKRVNLVLD